MNALSYNKLLRRQGEPSAYNSAAFPKNSLWLAMLTGSHACVAVVYLRHWALSVLLVCFAGASCAGQTPASAQQLPFDLVITNAHVMDPASGADVRGRNIGIRGKSI